ncbi:MAG: ABC transporter substrate-binding protein, partial [Methanobacteriota archaeon]
MKRKGLWIAITVVLVVVIGVVVWQQQQPAPQEEKEIKIGAILPLTGPASDIGQQTKEGLEIARKLLSVNVVYEDSKSEPKEGINAIRKLVLQHKKQLFGVISVLSSVGKAIIPVAEDEKIITLHISSAPGIVDKRKYA